MTAPRPVTTVLHIGADKTGTTAVQRALATRRAELAGHGVWYPDLDGRPDHRVLASEPRTPLTVPAGVDTVVLSSEALWSIDRSTIGPLLDALPDGPVTVVGYLRDPVDHAEAAFGQRLRLARSERELRALFAMRRVPALVNPIVGRARRRLVQLETWAAAVADHGGRQPAPRLLVRPYDRDGDVVADLCRSVGLDRVLPLLADRVDPRPNTSSGLVALHASVLVRQACGPSAQVDFLDAVAAARSGDGIGPGSEPGLDPVNAAGGPLLSPALRRRIRRRTDPILSRLEPLIDGHPEGRRPKRSDSDRADRGGADGTVLRLDGAEARALLRRVWPTFPAGAPGASG